MLIERMMFCLPLLLSLVLPSVGSEGFGSAVAATEKAPVLEEINQTYYVDGEEVLDASLLAAPALLDSDSVIFPETPPSSSWNMISKNLVDGSADFFTFDQDDYYYRQFAYDEEGQSLALSSNGLDQSDSVAASLEPTSVGFNGNGEEMLLTEGGSVDAVAEANPISPLVVIGDDDRTLVENTTDFPYRTTGKIVMVFNDLYNYTTGKTQTRRTIGTGFLEGPDLLVTAGHCLYGDVTTEDYDDGIYNPRFPDEVYFYPALNGDGNEPYGSVEVERIYLEDSYYLNLEKDWGCCKLADKIGNTTSYMGKISNFFVENYPLVSFGYPESKDGYMYQATGVMTGMKENDVKYMTTLDTEGGQSGSPYRIEWNGSYYVCGIHTYTAGDDSHTGGTRIDSFMFHFMNSFVTGDILYDIAPEDYGFADAYPTDDETATVFTTHELDNGLSFRTRRYRTGYIQQEYVVMSPIRDNIPSNEAFIEYSFDVPVNRIQVRLARWRPSFVEILNRNNGAAYLQVKDGEGWSNVFDILAFDTDLPEYRNSSKLYTIDFETPVYVFRFFSEYYGDYFVSGANRGRICIGSMTVWTQKDSYMPLNGSELEYEPSKWNDGDVRKYNCYAYALNTKAYGYMQPGQSEDHNISNTPDYLEKETLLSMVELDAENYGFSFEEIGKYERCDEGYYKVALVVDPGTDYHWYRQNYDGTWSHKMGSSLISNTDFSDNVIYDPETCDRTGISLDYSEFYGFYQIDVSLLEGQV